MILQVCQITVLSVLIIKPFPQEKEDGFVIMNFLKTNNVKLELNSSGISGLPKKTVTIGKNKLKEIIKDYEGKK